MATKKDYTNYPALTGNNKPISDEGFLQIVAYYEAKRGLPEGFDEAAQVEYIIDADYETLRQQVHSHRRETANVSSELDD